MRSEIISRILEQMDNDPWHVKLRRWMRTNSWVYQCYRRHYGPSQTITIMVSNWARRYDIVHRVKLMLAQAVLFIPGIAVLIHEAGMLVINFGLFAALIYMGKFLMRPIVKRLKALRL